MISFPGAIWRVGIMLSRVNRVDDRWRWTLAVSLGHRRLVLGRSAPP